MANPMLMHYAATRRNDNEMQRMPERRNTYDPDMRRNFYDEDYGAESRYRGRDGRWKSGTRRSEYTGIERPMESTRMPERGNMRMSDEDDDEDEKSRKYKIEVLPSNVVRYPSTNHEDGDYRTSRQIGFGAGMHMDEYRPESEHSMGQLDMEPMEFDRETAETWVRSMRNEDKSHPVGGKWTPDMIKPMAQKYGVPTSGKKFWELYAMTNAMYSDYGEVARKFGVTSPEFFVCMAKAWMEDKDAVEDKTAIYYECCVKK